jgi:chaperonin GroES
MEARSLEPLHDVVIIKPQILEKVGSIMIPIESKDFREDIGTVMYVGPGDYDDGKLQPMFVKPGDKVLFSTHGHQVTKIDGEELIVLRQNSIIGVWRGE